MIVTIVPPVKNSLKGPHSKGNPTMIKNITKRADYRRKQVLASLIPTSMMRIEKTQSDLMEITMDALFDSLTIDQQKQVIRYLSYYIKQRYTLA